MSNNGKRVAWVTGGGSGIGEAGAEALAADGFTAVVSGRRKEALDAVVDKITKAGGKAEAIPLGERLIEQETQLDGLFAKREITPASLQTVTAEIGATQARLREAHLKYYLAMRDLLTAEQIEKYQVQRGYRAGHGGQHRHK